MESDFLPLFALSTGVFAMLAFFIYCAKETVEHQYQELKKELKVSNSTIVAIDELNQELILALEHDLEHEPDHVEQINIKRILKKAKEESGKYMVTVVKAKEEKEFVLSQN